LPPGEIRSEGHLGPWKSSDLGQTPLSGSYTFEKANLRVFTGIAGTLTSEGAFKGMLGDVYADGNVDIPDFELTAKGNSAHLSAKYQASVNGLNGNVILHQVNTSILDTRVTATGSIAEKQGQSGKLTSIDLAVRGGRIQDLMLLFVTKGKPPLNGVTSMRARVTVPPEGKPFLKELQITGDFTIGKGEFTKADTRNSVDLLSQRASGEGKNTKKKTAQADDPPNVETNLEGHVVLRNEIARFSNASFHVPGATALMNGTYDLDNDRVRFQGTLKTTAEFSKTTSGIKSILLKPLDPFFKKRPSGSSVPINMTGTYPNLHFGIDLDQDKKHGK
ncbi:MAG: AsmA-like C-terminal region-containing protein, partial [Blastocatellia bacterium]